MFTVNHILIKKFFKTLKETLVVFAVFTISYFNKYILKPALHNMKRLRYNQEKVITSSKAKVVSTY